MAGNVWELTSGTTGGHPLMLGGSFRSTAERPYRGEESLREAIRLGGPFAPADDVGFRVALSATS